MWKSGVTAWVFSCLLVGCASTSIMEKADGNFLMVATSFDEGHALDAAKEDAQEHCAKFGKRFLLVSHKSEYQGADKTAKSVIGLIGTMHQNSHRRHGHAVNTYNGSQPDDHRVELTFQCR